MTINRTTLLDLPLPVTGTESGVWGDVVNNGLSQYIDISVAGSLSLSADSDTDLSSTEGNAAGTNIGSTTAQYAILRCTGARTATRNINAPAWAISGGTLTNYSKIYIVVNETTGSQNIVLRATNSATPTYTTGVTIVPGERAVCAWNGSDFVKVGGAAGGSTTQVQYNNAGVLAGSSNLTFDGTNLTVGGTATATKLIPTGNVTAGNGMYLPTTNTLAFSTNGSERMRIDSAGMLGLGLTPSSWYTGGPKYFQLTGDIGFAATTNNSIRFNNYVNTTPADVYYGNGYAGKYTFFANSGQHVWYSAASGTADNAITFTQVLAVEKDKSLALQGATSQSGTGITFPATQSASSNANTLDDYEEGTWTPTDASGAGLTFNTVYARYTKVGRLVHVQFFFFFPSTANGNAVQIGGLPFDNNGASYSGCPGVGRTDSGLNFFAVAENETTGKIFLVTNTNADITNSQMSTKFLQSSIVYFSS